MEGGGGRKRKAGPIPDCDKLLPSDHNDEEPAAQKSKPQAEVMSEGEEESRQDLYLKKISDKELIEKISRARNILGPGQMSSKLPDGGEKLQAILKRQEAELERRKHLKDDNKCKKASLLVEKSTCTGATDGLSPHGTLLSVPASQSTFALRFCSKLDDMRSSKSFGEELRTLNHLDRENMKGNEPFQIQRTQKMGLSSRQQPFRSPSHLLVNTDDPPQPNNKESGSQSCTPLLNPFGKDASVSGCFAKKENASSFQPTLTPRRNRKTVVLLDEEELQVDVTNQADQVGRSRKETRIYYPSRDDPEAIEICDSDLDCLAPDSYLSSTIMNFYIRYLQKPASSTGRKRRDYHFFNTYFYKKLKWDGLTKIDKEASYVKFRRWWKGVNIFEKAYIFLPIHENHHWSLVIICIPNKDDESGPIMLHLDSLGLHISKLIFDNVKSFLIEEWKFLRQEEVLPELPIADNIWSKLSRRIDEKVIEVPQQKNDYDCGLFVLYFMERFIEEAPERLRKKDLEMFGRQWFSPEAASSLRKKIRNLLREEFRKADAGTCKLDP